MRVKLLTDLHLEFLCSKGSWTCSFESTLVKMPHCWKSHVAAQFCSKTKFQLFYREKLAYITTVNMQVPVLPSESKEDVSQVEDLLQDGRMGHEV